MDQRGENPGQAKKSHRGHGCLSLVSVECCQVCCLCHELVPRPEESYRLWCVSNVCDHEASTKREEAQAHIRLSSHKKIVSAELRSLYSATVMSVLLRGIGI
jgi:hypothetical protein